MTIDTNIDRYLDEAFASLPTTADNADLKEEIRGNLAARVAELVAEGKKPDAASATAIKELGDIRKLVTSIDEDAPKNATEAAARLIQLNRVRLSPGFVIRTVLLSALLALAICVVVLVGVAAGLGDQPGWLVIAGLAFGVMGAIAVGILVTGTLRIETGQHYPMPWRRALGFGFAGAAAMLGLSSIALSFGALAHLPLLIVGCVLAFGALIAFISLGVTQTNRQKPWVKDLNQLYEVGDRFSEDPAAAARFGLYTVVIWVVAIAAFIVLSITIGFAWSWLPLVAALVVFFLVLARMLFPAGASKDSSTK